MQCSVCHNEVDPQRAFCANCGAPVAAAAAAPPTPGYTAVPNYTAAAPSQPAYAVQPMTTSAGLSDNTAAALSYVTIIPAIVFLVLEPYNKVPLIRFHSWQSIFLFWAPWCCNSPSPCCTSCCISFPSSGSFFPLIHFVVGIGLFILWLIAILSEQGRVVQDSIHGDFAEKQARGI